ncbi:hypothetical protein A2671_00250 [Candidatus Kaiserbacteria bacterium RIFCSPHIGHO2_01_FULL_49_13]|uniref:Dihydroorotate dehydrogenase catalytic domain-containing protein n=1 Tax=Candidatus Kaiserbacteria bacterium RIFCSPHIGHO2_01_FULL_49_13 TaxID=1798477 RepID=A0A1F6CFG0_9BACT|nr:MAG: hypothetical protein A2671_00250 [Candidatus Kaiserbacteria bacterium RIFCSPHIGHO2_01_FULL_49_13]
MENGTIRIMNAAGTCKVHAHVETLARSAVTDITLGSITVKPREINVGDVFWVSGNGASLNSLGLPNLGLIWYELHLRQMVKTAHDAGKRLRLSIAPFNHDDVVVLTMLGAQATVDEIEINLGCPNVWDGQVQKPIASFDTATVVDYLDTACRCIESWGRNIGVSAKVSPYSDPSQLEAVANAIASIKGVTAVVACNTFPNAFAWNGERAAISPGEGHAGLAGTPMKHITLGQVRKFRKLLPPHIDIYGAGGVRGGQDIIDLLRAKASAIQVGTAYADGEKPRIFTDILEEYAILADSETV